MSINAIKSNNTLILGEEVRGFPAVNIHDYNWIKLRDFAMLLNGSAKQFGIGYDQATNTITLTASAPYAPLGDELQDGLAEPITAVASPQRVLLDGKLVEVAAYNINGYNYFRLRDLAIMIDIGVLFSEEDFSVTLKLEDIYVEE
jgi:hypothetical protein